MTMLSCRHMTQLISKALDGPLSWLQRLALGIHLLGCPPCRRFRRAVQWLHAALPAAPCEACLTSAARDRIRRALEEAAGN
jgi:hypothetical protein